jgi:hypothetical protein
MGNTLQDDGTCQDCQNCSVGEFIVKSCDGKSRNKDPIQCQPCQQCFEGYFMDKTCTGSDNSDVECTKCGNCKVGQYIMNTCTGVSDYEDKICQYCPITLGKYFSKNCTGTMFEPDGALEDCSCSSNCYPDESEGKKCSTGRNTPVCKVKLPTGPQFCTIGEDRTSTTTAVPSQTTPRPERKSTTAIGINTMQTPIPTPEQVPIVSEISRGVVAAVIIGSIGAIGGVAGLIYYLTSSQAILVPTVAGSQENLFKGVTLIKHC